MKQVETIKSKLVLGFLCVVFGFYGLTAEAQLIVNPRFVTGPPGSKHVISLTSAPTTTILVGHAIDAFTRAGGTAAPTSGIGSLTSTLTLPNIPGTYLLAAAAGPATVSITVEVTALRLSIHSGEGQSGEISSLLPLPFVVTVSDVNGNPVAGQQVNFAVVSGGGYVSPISGISDALGQVRTYMTLGGISGKYTVQASVITAQPVLFTGSATAPVGSMKLHDGNNQTGPVNNVLPHPFVVRVLDNENKPLEGYTVRFEVTAGRGDLSHKSVRTDVDGYARTTFTPRSRGTLTIDAIAEGTRTVTFTVTTGHLLRRLIIVSGNNQTGPPDRRLPKPLVVEVRDAAEGPLSGIQVVFEVTGGGGLLSRSKATTNAQGQAQTFFRLGATLAVNTVNARIAGIPDPVTFKAVPESVEIPNQPAVYWVDTATGHLHRFFETGVENLRASVKYATGIAVDATERRIYWTERIKTNPGRGAIHRMKLDGTQPVHLKNLFSIPFALVVDPTARKLYWANSRGQIRFSNLKGRAVKTLIKGQEGITDIALDTENGKIYWTLTSGHIRRANLNNGKMIQNIASDLGEPLGIAIANGKVYWTEKTSNKAGKIRQSDLNGGNPQTLKQLKAVPIGIGIDTLHNKIYWTSSVGKIQRANLNGKKVEVVIKDLRKPGDLAFETTAGGSSQQTQEPQQQVTYSKYDINRDGVVNNADSQIVGRAIGQSGNSIKNKRTDVNKDGTVDALDLVLVVENADDAAAAPAIDVDVKSLDINFDRVQEQIEMLLASGDRSIAAQRALLYLQHLLANARPDETVLLANYPNPFNPETWIPYHLSESTEVKVNIYDSQGVLVRALTLGHQSAGYYTSRSRAAYWDGRNAFGERVASGIYFYQLQTDEMSPLRKMVILK